MRKKLSFVLASAAIVLFAAPAWAHHSFAAEFDQTKVVRLLGTITEMEWVNPHAVIHMTVKNPDGSVSNWAIEGNTPNSLLRAGLTKKSLAPGTQIAVKGYQARSGENKASASAILLKDGRKLTVSGREQSDAVLGWISSDEDLWRKQLAAWEANRDTAVQKK